LFSLFRLSSRRVIGLALSFPTSPQKAGEPIHREICDRRDLNSAPATERLTVASTNLQFLAVDERIQIRLRHKSPSAF